MAETIDSWSFSRLEVWKNCPRQAYLRYVKRVPEPERPKPPRGKEHANDRGSRMHENVERYINGLDDELCYENLKFEDEFWALRLMKEQHPDRVLTEELWCFNKDWNPVEPDSPDVWFRMIADLQVWSHDRKHLFLCDFKSGKRDRNEIKHGKQLQLYQLTAFMKYPEIETVLASLWYLDIGTKFDTLFTRETGLKFFPIFNDQALAMCSDEEYKPVPSEYRCKFCPYSEPEYDNKWVRKNGACGHGVG